MENIPLERPSFELRGGYFFQEQNNGNLQLFVYLGLIFMPNIYIYSVNMTEGFYQPQ